MGKLIKYFQGYFFVFMPTSINDTVESRTCKENKNWSEKLRGGGGGGGGGRGVEVFHLA